MMAILFQESGLYPLAFPPFRSRPRALISCPVLYLRHVATADYRKTPPSAASPRRWPQSSGWWVCEVHPELSLNFLEGYNTYPEHPVPDLLLGLPDETRNMLG